MNRKIFTICVALSAGFFLFACKKNGAAKPQWSAGTGEYFVYGDTYETDDTLAPDPFTSGKDLSMWPTGPVSRTQSQLFIYNMPSAGSGTFQLTDDPGGLYDTTCYILGNFPGPNGEDMFSSNGVTGSLTKTGTNSFTFTATAYIGSSLSDTMHIEGSGSY
ncbi:MAG TPA: hypothetical protein VL978_04085 [Puia sp.]|nr:hypothetical protein [Puia sp.]